MLLCRIVIVCLFGILIPTNAYASHTSAGKRTRRVPKVDIKLFYEAFCPGSRLFVTEHLLPTVNALAPYINVHVYPYGNAKTIYEKNGSTAFQCQHGPAECYGNKLHACAIHSLGDVIDGVIFNACMMKFTNEGHGSDDVAADQCAKTYDIDAKPIKQCAKGPRGTALMRYYGMQSKRQNFPYVPYILINGVRNNGLNFESDVCAAFKVPPPPCVH